MKHRTADRIVLAIQIIAFVALVAGLVQCQRMFPDYRPFDLNDHEGPGRALP